MHTAVGLRLGLTETEIKKLINPKKENFSYREWVAVQYARQWAFNRGKDPKGAAKAEFEQTFSQKEQGYIRKILAMMKMANYTSNLVFGVMYDQSLETGGAVPGGLLGRLGKPVEQAVAGLARAARKQAAMATDRTAAACGKMVGARACAA